MSSIRLIHIAPELPPTVGGVADYTAILSRRLVELSDGTVEPVLVDAGRKDGGTSEIEFPTTDLGGECSAPILADTIERLARAVEGQTVVLLEYSGYGYARRGAPLWLARGLSRVCGDGGIPLIAMFHEVSATGPIWTSAFWLSPVQTYVARRLARLSDGLITTHSTPATELRSFVGQDTPVRVAPVFSNVGEPESRASIVDRQRRAVIFGGERTKSALYKTYGARVQAALSQWSIDTIVDVGPPGAANPNAMTANVEVRGLQPAASISALLSNARVGLLHYPAAYATKSGILAAYLAHGIVPVLVEPDPLGGPLEAHTHFIPLTEKESEQNGHSLEGSNIGSFAAAWYDENAHSRRAASTALKLFGEI